jgi:hypothetical protein
VVRPGTPVVARIGPVRIMALALLYRPAIVVATVIMAL